MSTKESKLNQETLLKLISYDPQTGLMTRLTDASRRTPKGSSVGSKERLGYLQANINGLPYKVHRLAWLYMTGEWPKGQIDHINGIKDDNRFSNLRCVNNQQNCQNQHKPRKNNTSGYRGVSWKKQQKKWQAAIRAENKTKFLGYFDDPFLAHEAYKKAKAEYHA